MDILKAIFITCVIGMAILVCVLIAAIIWPLTVLACIFFVTLMVIKAEKTPG